MRYTIWQTFLPQLYFFAQIILSIFLGAVIGWQREKRGKAAGARTYALVTAGAAMFTILSANIFPDDPARIAAQIVTGIGFLGAGAILHKESAIVGLTTAAGLWITAAIGMAVGLGYYLLAILTTATILSVLMINERRLVHAGDEKDEVEE